jgi:hypothetical protein
MFMGLELFAIYLNSQLFRLNLTMPAENYSPLLAFVDPKKVDDPRTTLCLAGRRVGAGFRMEEEHK